MFYLSALTGIVFVAMAGVNVWLMVRADGSENPRLRARLTGAHRILGYAFVAVFCAMLAIMGPRYDSHAQMSPRILLHAALGLLLVPLLVTKILVARYSKSNGALLPLGIAIFSVSFVLVFLNVLRPALLQLAALHVPRAAALVPGMAILALIVALLRQSSTTRLARSENASPARIPQETPPALALEAVKTTRETRDVATLRFRMPAGQRLNHLPGQFLTFDCPIGGERFSRCYSISSSPTQSAHLEITPKRVKNGRVSTFLVDAARPGLKVQARGPMGRFYFDESNDREIVLIAGGSGIAPIMSILRYIDDRCLPTRASLIYFVRTSADVIFGPELKRLEASLANFRSVICLTKPEGGWAGHRGHIKPELLAAVGCNLAAATFFLCGPDGLMSAAQQMLRGLGVPKSRIKLEVFAADAAGADARMEPRPGIVDFARSGMRCRSLDGESVLEIAERCGLTLPFGCRRGQCGTCAVQLLKGELAMDSENGLTEDRKLAGYVLPCVGRLVGDVVLDA